MMLQDSKSKAKHQAWSEHVLKEDMLYDYVDPKVDFEGDRMIFGKFNDRVLNKIKIRERPEVKRDIKDYYVNFYRNVELCMTPKNKVYGVFVHLISKAEMTC